MKKISILALLVFAASSCTDNQTDSADGNVTLKASAVSSTGKTSLTARTAATSTVVLTDFKINIGKIKFETDMEDEMYSTHPKHDDVKLHGPFLLDLLDPNVTLSSFITSLNVPNARYEEIEFKFEKSNVVGEMYGKTYLIKGTINGKPFVIWSHKDAERELDFEDHNKDFTINSNDMSLNIRIHLDALMAKLTALSNQGLLLDNDGDGVIEISTGSDDDHNDIGELIKDLLEDETDLDDKD